MQSYFSRLAFGLFLMTFFCSCTPRVEVAAPPEPITINLNVKIEHEVRVKVDKDLDEVFADDNDLF